MEILTDVDGVLLNWEKPFHEWMSRRGFVATGKDAYDLHKCYETLDPAQVHDLIVEFNSSANMGFLPPLNDAIYWVRRWHEHHGVVFHCITSMGIDPCAIKLRQMNLERLFGSNAIRRVTVLGCGESKKDVLSQYAGTEKVWLEDHSENARVGEKLGLRTFLFDRPYNQKDCVRGVMRVNGWKMLDECVFPKS
jgi:hypothetical protein